jgi:hypothetical protein
MRIVLVGLAFGALLTACTRAGPSEDVAVTAKVASLENQLDVTVSGRTCISLKADVKQDGNRLVATARGHRSHGPDNCGFPIDDHGPEDMTDHVRMTLPDGTYDLDASGTTTTFLWRDGILSTGATKQAREDSHNDLAHTAALTRKTTAQLTAALPGWSSTGCGEGIPFLGNIHAPFTAQVVCKLAVPASFYNAAKDDVTAPHDAISSAFHCTPEDNFNDGELTCSTTIDGTAVVVHLARQYDKATLAIEEPKSE